ncbi:hypothetical protein [Crossiella sp. CA198]|uniref:hypothetical protein n=1 Tax=Crossiella sp. CA198 TaxID=3455607 RepID=UPI003F8D2C99
MRELARDGARLVVALGGTTVLPALAAATAELGLTFLSTALPWQVHRATCPPTAFHFCWGLDDIARTCADLWSRIPGADPVGLLWNNGPQGAGQRQQRGHRGEHGQAQPAAGRAGGHDFSSVTHHGGVCPIWTSAVRKASGATAICPRKG